MIPKIYHCYFGGPLHYLHYLSIWSFRKFNPDYDIRVYRPVTRSMNFETADGNYPELNVGNCWDRLLEEVECQVQFVNFERIGFYNGANEIHKSDYLRLYLLSTVGGIWADTDILWYKPFPEIPEQIEAMFSAHGDIGHSIGLLGANQDNAIYKQLLLTARNGYHQSYYQCMGSTSFNRIVGPLEQRRFKQQIYNIPNEWIYWVMDYHNSSAVVWCNNIQPPEDSIGLHWYAGDAMSRLGKNVDENYAKDNLMGNVIRRILK